MKSWTKIHSFIDGWGWRHTDGRCVWLEDIRKNLLSFSPSVSIDSIDDNRLDEIHEALQPFILEEQARVKAYLAKHPIAFDKISIPKVNREYPDLSKIFANNEAKK